MKITVKFELPDSYAACFCNDEDRIDSLIGSVDKDFTYSVIDSGIEDKTNNPKSNIMKSELQHRDRYEVADKMPSTRASKTVLAVFIVVIIAVLIIIFSIADSLFPVV